MKVSKIPGLGRFGAFIDDIDLMKITEDEWLDIGRQHITKNLVTIIRNSNATNERYAELVAMLGDPRPQTSTSRSLKKKYKKSWEWIVQQAKNNTALIDDDDKRQIVMTERITQRTENGYALGKIAGGYDKDGYPVGFFSHGELLWHSNESGTLTSTPGVALHGYQNFVGSATGFMTTPDYYESVSESFRSELDDMVVIHLYKPGVIHPGNDDPMQDKILGLNMCPDPNTEVPLVMRSPGGLIGLHYSPGTVHSIKGASPAESKNILDTLNKGLFQEKYIYDHWYQQDNDLLLFDNSITQHRRLGSTEGRLGYRIPHDYTYVQDEPWIPYRQGLYQRRYAQEIREVVEECGVTFRLPPFGLIDRARHWLEN